MAKDDYEGWSKQQLLSELAHLTKSLNRLPLHKRFKNGPIRADMKLIKKKLKK
jgi:hypothetical protein